MSYAHGHGIYSTFGLIFMFLMYSTFSNIFDELHFIKSLEKDVRIVKEIPKELESLPRARKHFTSWAGLGYYEEMTVLWKEYQASYFHLFFILLRASIQKHVHFAISRMRYWNTSSLLSYGRILICLVIKMLDSMVMCYLLGKVKFSYGRILICS